MHCGLKTGYDLVLISLVASTDRGGSMPRCPRTFCAFTLVILSHCLAFAPYRTIPSIVLFASLVSFSSAMVHKRGSISHHFVVGLSSLVA